MRASLLVACWNAVELSRVSLERALSLAGAPLELVAVDNGSEDATPRLLASLRRRAPRLLRGGRVVVLRNRRNRGYPAAMNQALAAARGEVVIFGNCDAAPTQGWLPAMLEALEARPSAGAVSPCSNAPGTLARRPWAWPPYYDDLAGLDRLAAAARLASPAPAFLPCEGFVPGFWLMTTREALRRAGGAFDERFAPGGFEDFDLQWRLRRAGLELGFAGRAYVHHVWFGCARANGLSSKRLYSQARRRRLLERKHPGAAGVPMRVRTFFDA